MRSSRSSGVGTLWPRRDEFEAAARTALDEYGLHLVGWPEIQYVEHNSSTLRFPLPDERRWVRFLGHAVPKLRASGWRIEIDPSFPYELIDAGDWDAQIEESANHWFEFDLGITVGGKRVSLLPIVIDALRELGVRSNQELAELNAETIYGRVREGAFVALPAARIAPLLAALVELFDAPLTREGRLALTPAHLSSIGQLERATTVRWTAGTRLRDLVRALADEEAMAPAVMPRTFKGTLRQYQERGVAWLQLLARNDFGGVLADDMGLGKTVAAARARRDRKGRADASTNPVLIVSPTSVSPNWRSRDRALRSRICGCSSLTGADRSEQFARDRRAHDVVLTTYALLQRDIETARARKSGRWPCSTRRRRSRIRAPRARRPPGGCAREQRLALTGTPMENHLDELWSVFRLRRSRVARRPHVLHARLPHADREARRRRAPASALATRTAPVPPAPHEGTRSRSICRQRARSSHRVDLDGAQRDLYETIRIAMHERVRDALRSRGLARSHIVVLDALLKLRQVCCDPRLLKMSAAQAVRGSAKLEALLEMVPELHRGRPPDSALLAVHLDARSDQARAARSWRFRSSSCAARRAIARRR